MHVDRQTGKERYILFDRQTVPRDIHEDRQIEIDRERDEA